MNASQYTAYGLTMARRSGSGILTRLHTWMRVSRDTPDACLSYHARTGAHVLTGNNAYPHASPMHAHAHTVYQIKLGTVDQTEAETEWVSKPYMNTAKKRNYL